MNAPLLPPHATTEDAAAFVEKLRAEDDGNVIHLTPPPTNVGGDRYAEWGEVDASLLDDRRGELPEFPLAALPAPIAKFVERAAHSAGVTPCHVALPLLSISSALIGAARLVKPNPSWSEPMAIWGGIIGASGTGKTPGIGVIKTALAQIERDRKLKVAELERKHESRSEAAKAAHKKWLKEVDEAVANNRPPPMMPPEAVKVEPFVPPRLYVSDTTIERLAVLLQARPSGISVLVDELAGLFSNMGRYSNGSDREFWLEAWNGKSFKVERMGRPAVEVDHLLVGIIGGMQPDKLTRAFEGDADGMYARFVFAWPPEPAYRPLSNDGCEVDPDLVNALTRLSRLAENEDDVFAPQPIRLDAGALAAFEQFRQFLHEGKAELDGREREWWAKGATQVLRLAGTLTFLNWAWSLGQAEPQTVAAASVNAAVFLWRDYFHAHSKAALRQIGLTDQQADARRVLKWIRLKGLTEVSREDIRRDALRQKLNAEQTEAVLNSLTRLNWLQKRTITHGSKAGRQAHRWLVNPCLANPTAEIAENAEMGAGRVEWQLAQFPQFPHPPWRIGNDHQTGAFGLSPEDTARLDEVGMITKRKGLQMTKTVAKPNKQPEPAKDLVKPYEPTPFERRTLDTLRERNAKKPLAPRMKVTNEKGATKLVPDHAEPSIAHVRLLEALGTRDFDFLDGLLKQLCNVGSHGKTVDENGFNFMLSVVKGIEPRDQVEAMLAAQIAATHNATMTFARRLAHVDTLAQQDSAERAYNKLARTFASQVDALKRYRSAGEQTVRVEHVTVNEGGQAIVGNVAQGGRARIKQDNPHETGETGVFLPKGAAVLGNVEADEEALHGSRGAGLDRLPVSWSSWWTTADDRASYETS